MADNQFPTFYSKSTFYLQHDLNGSFGFDKKLRPHIYRGNMRSTTREKHEKNRVKTRYVCFWCDCIPVGRSASLPKIKFSASLPEMMFIQTALHTIQKKYVNKIYLTSQFPPLLVKLQLRKLAHWNQRIRENTFCFYIARLIQFNKV